MNSDIFLYTIILLFYKIYKGLSIMDTRLLVIAAPVLIAGSWALYNIGRLALQQLRRMR